MIVVRELLLVFHQRSSSGIRTLPLPPPPPLLLLFSPPARYSRGGVRKAASVAIPGWPPPLPPREKGQDTGPPPSFRAHAPGGA